MEINLTTGFGLENIRQELSFYQNERQSYKNHILFSHRMKRRKKLNKIINEIKRKNKTY